MTITSSLNAGVMGLNVNATRLAAISNNISNSATYGYKRVDVDFSSMVVDQRPSAYSAGGVRATVYRNVADSGTLINTGRSTDIAVNGGGMIPVTTLDGVNSPAAERDFLMTPTGGFFPNENGLLQTNSGLFLLGWPMGDDGNPITTGRSSQTGLVPINLDAGRFSAEATENISLGVNLPADTSLLAPGESYSLPVEYYNPLGLSETLELDFVPAASGTGWSVRVDDNSSGTPTTVASFDITFDANGAVDSVLNATGGAYDTASGEFDITLPTGPINLFLGRPGTTGGLSQIGTNFQPISVGSDGAPAGELQSVEITPQGFLEAVYNTGVRRVLYQIPVAEVNNPDGMIAVGNEAFQVSANSGDVYLWDAGDGPSGEITGYALMESNTDIAAELTNLIETQRAYSSNAKIIQTVDEMLQETTNLKR